MKASDEMTSPGHLLLQFIIISIVFMSLTLVSCKPGGKAKGCGNGKGWYISSSDEENSNLDTNESAEIPKGVGKSPNKHKGEAIVKSPDCGLGHVGVGTTYNASNSDNHVTDVQKPDISIPSVVLLTLEIATLVSCRSLQLLPNFIQIPWITGIADSIIQATDNFREKYGLDRLVSNNDS